MPAAFARTLQHPLLVKGDIAVHRPQNALGNFQRFLRQGAAAVQPAQVPLLQGHARRRFSRQGRQPCQAFVRALWRVRLALGQRQAAQRRFLKACGYLRAAFRRQFGRTMDKLNHGGLFAVPQPLENLPGRCRGGGLGNQTDHPGFGIRLQQLQGLKHGAAAHLGAQIAPANADGVAHAAALTVDDIHYLLHAAAARADQADIAPAHLAA